MVKIEVTETELGILHWAVERQLDRLLRAREEGHSVDENTVLPILKKLKEKTFVKTSEREERTKIVA
jgi:DNA-binding PadR family transcriptional regulator